MIAIDFRTALDIVAVLLLAGALAYVAVLARRMHAARGEIAQVQSALIELAKIVGQANRGGGGTAGEHDDLRDDLAFLVERGATLADRLEQDLRLGLVRQRQTGTGGAADARGHVVSLPELKLIKSLREPR
jgi:hypothetical protein